MADDDGGFGDWGEEEAVEEVAEEVAEGEPTEEGEEGATEEPTEGETGAEGEEEGIPDEELEPQEPERKLFWSKWERPKSHIYDYNYGYFNNYYSGMVDQITSGRSRLITSERPLAESWAERSIRMYNKTKRSRMEQAASDLELANKIRTSHNEYFRHRNELSTREVGYHRA